MIHHRDTEGAENNHYVISSAVGVINNKKLCALCALCASVVQVSLFWPGNKRDFIAMFNQCVGFRELFVHRYL